MAVHRFELVVFVPLILAAAGCGGGVDGTAALEEDGMPQGGQSPTPTVTTAPSPPPPPTSDDAKMIALAKGRPLGLALDTTHVYWTDAEARSVMKISKAGGMPTSMASSQKGPSGIAVRDGIVSWTNTGDGTVKKAPSGGGSVVTLAEHQASPRSVAIAGGHAYFTTDGALMRVPLSGGGAAVALTPKNGDVPLGQGGVQGITTDGVLVYAAPYQVLWPVDGDCTKPSTLGLCIADWYAGPGMRGGAVDGAALFFAWGSEGIGAGIFSSQQHQALVEGQAGPEAVVVDDTHVYWVNRGTEANGFLDGSIMRTSRSGGPPSVIAANQPNPVAIALDASFVFWTNHGTGEIGGALMRAPK